MATPDPQTQPDFYKDVPLKRFMAWGVDAVLTFLACLVILPFTAFTGLFFFPLLFLVVGFIYRMITIANGSATWGMRLFAIELRTSQGTQLDVGGAFAHTLGYTVSWGVAPLQLISMVMMATTERGQGLTDHVLGTVMINRRAAHR
ncbi:RDD family protein [Roseobacter sp.]|uniref:RDD family protein n=1 Tax=Roseobacter sp. TaxID=1907202 RepID=UPI00262D966B|nr:RDD family protein [Roseobacter sp.]MDW3184029.1 RDD family protein [Roseobacter sp.]